ncbi:MAG TPA: acetate--CoA ligase family protein, partial [Actinotalea sp.]|nr:acetate--CoA ligase family protein [Actinotalea sp.]
ILRLVEPTAGRVRLDGVDLGALGARDLRRMRRKMQIVFQDPYSSLNPRMNVEGAITEPMVIQGLGGNRRQRRDRAAALLEEVGMSANHLRRYPHEFSGGQRQRICIARAVAVEPELLICDESVSALDVSVQAQVLNLLKRLQETRGLTYIFISHDLSVVKFMADMMAVMNAGRIVEFGPSEAIYAAPRQEYTRRLIEATPKDDLEHIRAAVARRAASGRTTVAVILGLSGLTEALTAPDPGGAPRTVPAFPTPEDAVAALAAATRYAGWRAADRGGPLAPDGLDRARARRLVDEAFDRLVVGAGREVEPVVLSTQEAAELLGCYGIEVWPHEVVQDGDQAVAAAERLGWPVALTAMNPALRHRVDLGGVRLGLQGPAALREAMAAVRADPPEAGPWRVQRMAPTGASCVLSKVEDPRFGPVVSFGLSGDAVDLLGDVSYGVAPLTAGDVADMVRSVRASPRLFGYRGLPPLDVTALEDVLGRLAVMADDLPSTSSSAVTS